MPLQRTGVLESTGCLCSKWQMAAVLQRRYAHPIWQKVFFGGKRRCRLGMTTEHSGRHSVCVVERSTQMQASTLPIPQYDSSNQSEQNCLLYSGDTLLAFKVQMQKEYSSD